MTIFVRIKNWAEFQHYKDRNPPWIKLHRALLDDYEFTQLPDADKAHLMLIWLFASHQEGRIPADPEFLSRKIGATQPVNVKLLIDMGFLIPEQNASDVLAACLQSASTSLASRAPPRSQETEAETETPSRKKPRSGDDDPRFARFWAAYPKHKDRAGAAKAFARVNPDDALLDRILRALEMAARSDDWRRDGGQYIPHAETWLNRKRWEDEVVVQLPLAERKAVQV